MGEQRRVRETEELYRSLIQALDEGIVVHDADGSITATNPAAERILGLTADELTGRTPTDPRWHALAEDGSPLPNEEYPTVIALRTGRPAHDRVIGVAQPSGEIRWVRATAQPLRHGGEDEIWGVVTSFLDVTDAREAEERLRASEAYFRSLVEQSSDVFTIVDGAGALRYASPAARRVLGWDEAAMRGTSVLDLVHPDDLAHAAGAFGNTAAASGVQEPIELRIRRADGSYASMEIVANNLLADRAINGIVLTARDLTERRRVEEALRTTTSRLRTLIESLPSAVLVEDVSGRITLWNTRLTDIFWPGETPPQLDRGDAHAAARLFASRVAEPEAFLARIHHIRSRDEQVVGDELDLADGRCVERDFLPIVVDAELRERVWVYRDITARKRTEAEVAAARDSALDASRAKSEFLAALSHEVRTPMSAIIGMVDLLLQMPLGDDLHDLVGGVRGAADSLMDVLNDILDLARIEAGRIDIEDVEFDPREVVEGAAQTLAPIARKKGLLLSTSCDGSVPALVTGDPGRFRQVLINLVGNAVKFTDQGEVSVAMRARPGNGRVRLAVDVIDTGIGLDIKTADLLFEPFTQARSIATRSHAGSGLGLAISRRLVGLMGGSITVDSAPGRGSTFSFDLDLELAAPPRGPLSEPLPTHVALVGLPVHAAEALATTMRTWGVEVSVVETASVPACDVALVADALLASGEIPLDVAERVVAVGLGAFTPPDGVDALVLPARHDRLLRVLTGAEPRMTMPSGEPHTLPPLEGRIVLAEDSEVNRAIEVRMLEQLGITVVAVPGGAEAVAAVAEQSPDVVLMDCFMPDVDGFEATRRIRASEPPGTRIPILALTASAMGEDRERCAAAGMDAYVTKPVTAARLRAALEPWLPAPGEAPVDGDALAELADQLGDVDVLVRVITTYLRELPDRLDTLVASATDGDAERVAAVAHTLCSSSAALSARRLAEMCGRLEQHARSGDGDLRVDATAVAREAARVRDALVAARDGFAGAQPSPAR